MSEWAVFEVVFATCCQTDFCAKDIGQSRLVCKSFKASCNAWTTNLCITPPHGINLRKAKRMIDLLAALPKLSSLEICSSMILRKDVWRFGSALLFAVGRKERLRRLCLDKLDVLRILNKAGRSVLPSALETLELRRCRLFDDGIAALAPTLCHTALKVLDLSVNGLTNDCVDVLAASLRTLTALEALNLSFNEIDGKGLETLVQALVAGGSVQDLNISANDLDAHGLGHALRDLAWLKALDLSLNDQWMEASDQVAHALDGMTSLERLNLSGNTMCPLAMLPALRRQTALRSLNLSGTSLNPAAALTNATGLRELHLSYLQMGVEGVKPLAAVLERTSLLQTLILRENALGPQGTKILAPALKRLTHLRQLNLGGNALGDEGVCVLVPSIADQVQCLDLSKNRIGYRGVEALHALSGILRKLHLGDNVIGDKGAGALASVVTKNAALDTLNLWKNDIGAAGAMALAPVLGKNLRKLHLSSNDRMGATGAAALVSSRCLAALQELDLDCADTVDVLASQLQKARALLFLRIGDLDYRSIQILALSLKDASPRLQISFRCKEIIQCGLCVMNKGRFLSLASAINSQSGTRFVV
jgi:Ran GTPase-activating protein (RanGAP) involved in mRNA processing and transport